MTGRLRADFEYDAEARDLRVVHLDIEAPELDGTVEGRVGFADVTPALDLRIAADRLPVDSLLKRLDDPRIATYGDLEVTVAEPYRLTATVSGLATAPNVTARLSLGGGTVAFAPKQKTHPKAELREAKTPEERSAAAARISMRRLAGSAQANLDAAFAAITAE